ncbi:MAG: type II CAAX endopeptidase family protein [Leptolyngbyaceae bacterium]|nr:type II CAAX endopeptidase family protein [Leptolyngbyaceae bacterium]
MKSVHSRLRRVGYQSFPVRFVAFIGLLAIAWTPLALVVSLGISSPEHRGTGLVVAVLISFLGVLFYWNRLIYGHPIGLVSYGGQLTRQNGAALLLGWSVGSGSLILLFGVEGLLGWLSWQLAEDISLLKLGTILLEGLLVAIAVAIGEELLFRGWLLTELDKDYSPVASLWVSSLLFAIAHFIKPIEEVIRTFPQFPGLVLLGLILVWARRSRHGLLGLSIGLHGGLVWAYYLIQVGQLATISDTAPELWVGIDQNPLAGGLGLISLSFIAIWVRRFEARKARAVDQASSPHLD